MSFYSLDRYAFPLPWVPTNTLPLGPESGKRASSVRPRSSDSACCSTPLRKVKISVYSETKILYCGDIGDMDDKEQTYGIA